MGASVKPEAKHHIAALYTLHTLKERRFMDAEGEAIAGIWMPGITLAATWFYVKNTIGPEMPTREGVNGEA